MIVAVHRYGVLFEGVSCCLHRALNPPGADVGPNASFLSLFWWVTLSNTPF